MRSCHGRFSLRVHLTNSLGVSPLVQILEYGEECDLLVLIFSAPFQDIGEIEMVGVLRDSCGSRICRM